MEFLNNFLQNLFGTNLKIPISNWFVIAKRRVVAIAHVHFRKKGGFYRHSLEVVVKKQWLAS